MRKALGSHTKYAQGKQAIKNMCSTMYEINVHTERIPEGWRCGLGGSEPIWKHKALQSMVCRWTTIILALGREAGRGTVLSWKASLVQGQPELHSGKKKIKTLAGGMAEVVKDQPNKHEVEFKFQQ
jgi:hypothetical protein